MKNLLENAVTLQTLCVMDVLKGARPTPKDCPLQALALGAVSLSFWPSVADRIVTCKKVQVLTSPTCEYACYVAKGN